MSDKFFTKCQDCCFNKDNSCQVNLFTIKNDNNEIIAPGICKYKRDKEWINRNNYQQLTVNELIDKINSYFPKYDLIIIFDENKHTLFDLQYTINYTKFLYFNDIIIADITGMSQSNNNCLEYIRKNKITDVFNRDIKVLVDISIDKEINYSRTVSRISNKIKSEFFLVLMAGEILSFFSSVKKHIGYNDDRCAFWYFPKRLSGSLINPKDNVTGLYMTSIYRFINNPNSNKTFLSQLKELDMNLWWFHTDTEVLTLI